MNCIAIPIGIIFASAAAVAAALPSQSVTHVPLHEFAGTRLNPPDLFGFSVDGTGDVNGDGVGDVIIGIPASRVNGAGSGAARVYSGLTGEPLYALEDSSYSDGYAYSVAGIGDVNADGRGDIVIGARWVNSNGVNSGSAYVYSGADGSRLYTFDGDSRLDLQGFSVSGAGDVDGDGTADIIVGAPGDNNNGSARIYSGADGATLFTLSGDASGDEYGYAVSGAGDVNGDGHDDVIVGARFSSGGAFRSGTARVHSGANGEVLHTFLGVSLRGEFGSSVGGAGDVNGDGFGDLIVGARYNDINGEDSGSARVFSGATGETLYTLFGERRGDNFGYSVSGAGDVNGDGRDDFMIGAVLSDNNGDDTGNVRVYSGLDGGVLYSLDGASTGNFFGNGMSGAGDINGDGLADFIIGASGGRSLYGDGYAQLYVSRVGVPEPRALAILATALLACLNTRLRIA